MLLFQICVVLKYIYIKKTYMLLFYISKVYRDAITNLCSIEIYLYKKT